MQCSSYTSLHTMNALSVIEEARFYFIEYNLHALYQRANTIQASRFSDQLKLGCCCIALLRYVHLLVAQTTLAILLLL